eukprot:299556-Pleurochrysis_carterae.AAC.1
MSDCARASLVMSAVVCFASRSGADCSVEQETNFQRACAHSAVLPGKELAFDTFWERGHELPPFKVDNDSAVDFLLVALSSPVGTVVKHSLSVVTEAVAVQIHQLLTSEQLDRVNARPSAFAAMPAVYMALASLHCNERVPQPSEKTLKRLAVASLRKGKVQ